MSVHLREHKVCFTFDTAVVTAVWAGQKCKWSKMLYIADKLHSHTLKGIGNRDHIEDHHMYRTY